MIRKKRRRNTKYRFEIKVKDNQLLKNRSHAIRKTMRIQQIPLDKIKPYPKNNRIHPEKQIEHIADSIKTYGFTQNLILDDNFEIIAGHGRYLAAQKLGLKDAPCIQIDWKERYKIASDAAEDAGYSIQEFKKWVKNQVRALRIADNKLQNDSTWEIDNLKIELTDLAIDGFDLLMFDLEKLAHVLEEDEPDFPENEGPNEDPDPELIRCPKCNHQFDPRRKDVKGT